MELSFVILVLVLIAVAVGLVTVLKKKDSRENDQSFLMMQQQLQDLTRLIDQKMSDTNRTVSEAKRDLNQTVQHQFGQNVKIVADLTERLTKIDETNKQLIGFATQLQNIEDVLQNPKHRGILGEYLLENVLKNVLPPGSYQMQYAFKDGDIVDAAIFIKDQIIPVDSKFSLENYNRLAQEKDPERRKELETLFRNDLKKRIDETSKYIKQKEGTMDFAFMFIPAEGIYYDLLVNQVGAIKANTHDLIEYAFRERHVIIVSPTSFLAYLQTVMQGLRAMKIEESAKEIRERVEDLGKHILAYEDYLKKLGNTLGTSVSHYNNAYKEFNKIDKDVIRITDGEKTVEPILLDKPNLE
jgi:DNA recombination protein RmuC